MTQNATRLPYLWFDQALTAATTADVFKDDEDRPGRPPDLPRPRRRARDASVPIVTTVETLRAEGEAR